jgi:hypothetical protein
MGLRTRNVNILNKIIDKNLTEYLKRYILMHRNYPMGKAMAQQ